MPKYKTRSNPLFSACGLNCGLCPRHHAEGSSRCHGCAGDGFSDVHPSCGVLACCQKRDLEYCFKCGEYPCAKYDGADAWDSFITHRNQFSDLDKARKGGIENYATELSEKIALLQELLRDYDDGRRKSFYCLAVNLLEPSDATSIIERLRKEVSPNVSVKEKAGVSVRLFTDMAEQRGLSLKLRKKVKD
jgi:hypothetical protein